YDRRSKDGGHDGDEARDAVAAVQLLGTNPSLLDVFPIEADPAIRSVEEEWMDDVECRAVSSEDRISRSTECDCADPGLFPNLHDGPGFRISAALDVPPDSGPLAS